MKIVKDIIHSFKKQPLWTLWSLLLCPFYYVLLLLTGVMLGLINLSFNDFVDFMNENT